MNDQAQSRVRRIAMGGLDAAKQLRGMISRMVDDFAVARQLFYGDGGALTPAAVEWFDRIGRRNFIHGGGFDRDPHVNAYNAGRRDCVLEILESVRLDSVRLAQLRQMLKAEE